jgi:hypothetical protein
VEIYFDDLNGQNLITNSVRPGGPFLFLPLMRMVGRVSGIHPSRGKLSLFEGTVVIFP